MGPYSLMCDCVSTPLKFYSQKQQQQQQYVIAQPEAGNFLFRLTLFFF